MRPLAVELAFDHASDQRLGRVWSRLLELYAGPKDSDLGVRSHITLALFRSGEPRNVGDLIQSLAKVVAPFDLNLAVADRSPTSEGVVFLRPEPSRELTRAHAILHELLGPDRGLVHAYYRPPAWTPYCTMAINVAEPFIDAVLSAWFASGG
jgi:2'-5' RNA ligase